MKETLPPTEKRSYQDTGQEVVIGVKVRVSCEDLSHAMQDASRAVSSRASLPILTGILLDASDECLRLCGNDLELGIETYVNAHVSEPGQTVLPARYLVDIVKTMPSGEVAIDVAAGENSAAIKWQRTELTIQGQPPEEFPVLAEAGRTGHRLKSVDFRKLARQTLFACSRDETRPVLTGALLHVTEDSATCVATDGFRLAYSQVAAESDPEATDVRVVVPSRALQEVSRLAVAEGQLTLVSLDNFVSFGTDGTRLVSRLQEGQFPDYQQILPKEFLSRIELDRQELSDACERAALIATDAANAINLKVAPEKIIITAQATDVGSVYEELDAATDGEELDIAFNARYLMDGLKAVNSDTIVFEATGNLGPARLTGAGDDRFFYILLPLRRTE